MKPIYQTAMALCLMAVLTVGPVAAQDAPNPTVSHPTIMDGWGMRVLAERLPQVDNLAVGPQDTLYATLELPGDGKVVRFVNGQVEKVLDGLRRADGLLINGHHLFVTEEIHNGRIIMLGLKSGKLTSLGRFRSPEGIEMLPDGGLIISEDRMDGRLLRLEATGGATPLAGPFRRPEGLAVAADGTILVAETATGRVLAIKDGAVRVVAAQLNEPDQLGIGPDGALWISEDRPDGRLLRIKDGHTTVVVSNLHYPQGIAFMHGQVLLAEQGRGRILALSPNTAF